MLQGVITHLKTRLDLALKSAACGAIAAVAVLIALAFFGAAAFVALAAQLGAIDACLIFGGVFVVVAAIAATIVLTLRRRAARTRVRLAQAIDPQTLAMGYEFTRLLGGRRAASMGLIGAFIIGILISRSVPRK